MNKFQQAKDLAKNIFKAAAGLATGKFALLDAQEKKRRLKICYECPFFSHDNQQCTVCACKGRFLELKASVNLWNCVKGYWGETVKIENDDLGYCMRCKGAIVKISQKDDISYGHCVNGCYSEYHPEQAIRKTALDPRVQQRNKKRKERK